MLTTIVSMPTPTQEAQIDGATAPAKTLAYGGGGQLLPNQIYRLERGSPRYRQGYKLAASLPQFKAAPVYVKNSGSVPTGIPITQATPATSPLITTSTGKVAYPIGPNVNRNAPSLS